MFIKIHMPYRPWRKEPECWGSEIYSSIVTGWGSSCCLLHYHPLLFRVPQAVVCFVALPLP
ncbi:hypothetical protein ACSBR1_025083 [Camellia fascicularis]